MPVTRFGLAQRIIARFERRGAPRRVAEVLLRRQRRLSMRRVWNVGVAVHLHRRDVSMRAHTIERRIARAAATLPVAFRRQAVAGSFVRTTRAVEHATFQHVLAREVRRETLTRDRRSAIVRDAPARPPAAAPHTSDAARPIEFVLRRAAAAIEKDGRGKQTADIRTELVASSQAAAVAQRRESSAIPLTPSELSRLTDDVVRAIDRRFLAHRERRGVV